MKKEQSLQELPDVAPVHTHGWHLGAAVLVEFVATRLTPKAIEQELLADVTEGKLQKCLPSLENTASDQSELITSSLTEIWIFRAQQK